VPHPATHGKASVNPRVPNLTSRALMMRFVRLDEHHGLGAGDVETLAATATGEHVIHAHHVITRVLELALILFAGAAWRLLLLGSSDPAHFVIGALATMRTRK
jgi:hypothetical protein